MLVGKDSEVRGCPNARSNLSVVALDDLLNWLAILQRNEGNPYQNLGQVEKSLLTGWRARAGTPGPKIWLLAPFLGVLLNCQTKYFFSISNPVFFWHLWFFFGSERVLVIWEDFGDLARSRPDLRNFPGTHWGNRDHKTQNLKQFGKSWLGFFFQLQRIRIHREKLIRVPQAKSQSSKQKVKVRPKSASSPIWHLQQPWAPL